MGVQIEHRNDSLSDKRFSWLSVDQLLKHKQVAAVVQCVEHQHHGQQVLVLHVGEAQPARSVLAVVQRDCLCGEVFPHAPHLRCVLGVQRTAILERRSGHCHDQIGLGLDQETNHLLITVNDKVPAALVRVLLAGHQLRGRHPVQIARSGANHHGDMAQESFDSHRSRLVIHQLSAQDRRNWGGVCMVPLAAVRRVYQRLNSVVHTHGLAQRHGLNPHPHKLTLSRGLLALDLGRLDPLIGPREVHVGDEGGQLRQNVSHKDVEAFNVSIDC